MSCATTEPTELCDAVAELARKLCVSEVQPTYLRAFVAERLIPLDKKPGVVVSWAIVGMHPPINPIRSRWIRPAPGPLWTHLLEVPLLDQKELDLGHDKTDLKSSGSAIILFYVAVCQPDHIYTRYVPCISFERSCILNI